MTVTVRRHWSGPGNTLTIPVRELRDFHSRDISGGVQVRSPRPFLHARMLCTSIPEGHPFPHSCRHGPPPHEILVCITRTDNDKATYQHRAGLARGE
jgi:hypothetical protein